MGWCHEFGSSIRDGCSHPMVAGADSCSCEQCGTVCRGKFPACDAVWERGPRQVTLVRPVVSGHAMTGEVAVGALALGPAQGTTPDTAEDTLDWLRLALDGVRADLRALTETVRRQQELLDRRTEVDEAYDRLVALVKTLPERIGSMVNLIAASTPPAATSGTRAPAPSRPAPPAPAGPAQPVLRPPSPAPTADSPDGASERNGDDTAPHHDDEPRPAKAHAWSQWETLRARLAARGTEPTGDR